MGAACGLTLERKPVSFQGSDDFSNSSIAQGVNEIPEIGHTETLTAGVSLISISRDEGIGRRRQRGRQMTSWG